MTEKSTLSRRGLLKGAFGAALAAGAGTAAAAFHVDRVDQWDETYDMVIVGSGFAGLAAAYQAKKEGVERILVLEKMEAYGGNSALCGALMCMPCTKMQKAQGIEDSPERLVEDMLAAGRGFNHRDLERPQPTMNTLRNWSGHPQAPPRSRPAECHQL